MLYILKMLQQAKPRSVSQRSSVRLASPERKPALPVTTAVAMPLVQLAISPACFCWVRSDPASAKLYEEGLFPDLPVEKLMDKGHQSLLSAGNIHHLPLLNSEESW